MSASREGAANPCHFYHRWPLIEFAPSGFGSPIMLYTQPNPIKSSYILTSWSVEHYLNLVRSMEPFSKWIYLPYPSGKEPKREIKLGRWLNFSHSSVPVRLVTASLAQKLQLNASRWCDGTTPRHITFPRRGKKSLQCCSSFTVKISSDSAKTASTASSMLTSLALRATTKR